MVDREKQKLTISKGLIVLLTLLILYSCNKGTHQGERPLVKVYDQVLYESQLKGLVSQGISEEDSLDIVKKYIDKWILQQLVFHQAQAFLTEEEKDISRQIEDYKTSLLIYKYKQKYADQKLNKEISAQEVEKYYKKNPANFTLNDNIIKGIYIKAPLQAANPSDIRKWCMSDEEQDIKELESFCFKYADDYKYFEEKWVSFDKISKEIPNMPTNLEAILRQNAKFETQDAEHYYFLKVTKFKLVGELAPLSYVEADIESILLNKKKIKLLENLENKIYNEALNKNNVTIY